MISPKDNEGWVSWCKQDIPRRRLGEYIAFLQQERKGLVATALAAGDTDHAKGKVDMIDQVLNTFSFLADTETETGIMPDTETETAKE